MAYDVELADRLREALVGVDGVSEQRMFGGLAFLVGGHMAVAASSRGGLLVRVDPAQSAALIAAPGVAPMVMRGRELAGWLHVEPGEVAGDAQLSSWVACGVAHARSLPPKRPSRARGRPVR
jgi:hypothetical protein